MNKWNAMKFKNFIKLNRGFDLPNDKMIFGEYPVVASTNIKGYHNSYKIDPPCVVTGRSGSLGGVQYINKKCTPLNTTLYVKDFKNNSPRFVYYYLKTMHLEQFNAGAGVPTLNQNHLHGYGVLIPDLHTQKRIANILSAYDDLIENNNRRIALLDKAAQELYKEWFVRFRFPGHENAEFEYGLPKKWEIKKVKDVIKRYPFGMLYKGDNILSEGKVIIIDQSVSNYAGFHNDEPSHIATIDQPMILFGDHTCKYQLMITPFSLSENVVPFAGIQEIDTIYLFYLVNGIIKTTEYKRHWKEFVNKKIIVADKHLQGLFNKKIKDNLLLIESLRFQNNNLSKQRDLLLHRLMSGKLEV